MSDNQREPLDSADSSDSGMDSPGNTAEASTLTDPSSPEMEETFSAPPRTNTNASSIVDKARAKQYILSFGVFASSLLASQSADLSP